MNTARSTTVPRSMKRALPFASIFFGTALVIPATASATPQRGVAIYRIEAGPAGYPARPASHRVHRTGHRHVHRRLRRARTDRQRLRILERAPHLRLTMAQSCDLLMTFQSSYQRLQALRLIKYRIVDSQNLRVLNEAFERRSDRRKARRIVRSVHSIHQPVKRTDPALRRAR